MRTPILVLFLMAGCVAVPVPGGEDSATEAAEATSAYDVTPGTEIDHMLVNGRTMVDEGVRVDLG